MKQERVAKRPVEPVIPMEPKRSEQIPTGSDWIAQVKWDGVRVLVYADGQDVQLFNRKARKRTLHYPELLDVRTYCTTSSVVLDGEVIALGQDGTPDFHEVMRRDGIRRMERVASIQKVVPITYMVFDVLFYEGEWVTHRSFGERAEILSSIITPNPQIQVVSSHEDGTTLFDVMKQHGMEGVVMKKLDSPYLVGQKTSHWVKVKNYRDLIAVIGGYTLNDAGVVNAVLLGLYDEAGDLHYIGHTGTGKLSHQEWRELTSALRPLTLKDRLFVNRPERAADAYWVRPEITAKIQFAEWTQGRALRQPSIQGIVDVPSSTCRMEQEVDGI